jgi:S-adenosylmethionine:tRNA ribosyltransferase-isomerase
VSRESVLSRLLSDAARGTRTSDYDFALPPDLIAQHPPERREDSRLLVVDRAAGTLSHKRFNDIADLVQPGDAMVLNTTRVLRARLLGTRDSGAPAEVMLLRDRGDHVWEAMVHPGGKLKPGRTVRVGEELTVEILEVTDRRTRLVKLHSPLADAAAIEKFGRVPLPPYIDRADTDADESRYQTVFANQAGSVAAPTAGLHFTTTLLESITQRGARRVEVLLHVGAGTFKPVEVDDPSVHQMHDEYFEVSAEAAAVLNETRASGGSVWAVGTTAARTLESVVSTEGRFESRSGETSIFIRPPYRVRAVDKLVTNFHLPRSTLLMLVAAFAGYDLTMRAYQEAIDAGYRFYSYGDAMVIV